MRKNPSLDFTKSSVFSLTSTTTAITVNKNIAKKKVVKKFLSIYQSSFFISLKVVTKIIGGDKAKCEKVNSE